MNPIYKTQILQGHGRPIKNIKFSTDGTQIYSASADRKVIRWDYQANSKASFTFTHQASVNVICISPDNKTMLTGDSTGCIYIWDIDHTSLIKKIEFDPCLNVRSIEISTDNVYAIVTLAARTKNSKSLVNAYLMSTLTLPQSEEEGKVPPTPIKTFECTELSTKFVQAKFTNYNKSLLISREDGGLEMINFENGNVISCNKFHDDIILDFDVSFENGIILTSSKDGYLSLINLNTFQLVRKFHPENPTRNLNACVISVIDNPYYNMPTVSSNVISVDNLFDLTEDINTLLSTASSPNNQSKFGKGKEIILAIASGGQDSKFVTTTNQKEGGFDILIYNAMNGELLASFLDHFGPVNSLAVHDKTLASGAEDATVRIHKIDHYLFDKK